MVAKALIDNTAFAGVMRLYSPRVEMHEKFLRNYPEHRAVDQRSLADFLTAVCLYETILLDSSSAWNDKELQREGYSSGEILDGSTASWAEQLVRLLPNDIAQLIKVDHFNGQATIDEDESCQKAFDIICSPLKTKIDLQKTEKLPNVYFADDYVYRSRFERINAASGNPLDTNELAQAMFLHRGLFLQSRAHKENCVYMPYQLRGRILAELPPMIWAREPNDGILQARLPLARGKRPQDTDYVRALNEYYYSLLEVVSWTTYDQDIPFIGAAILSRASGNPSDAFTIALELREKGELRARFVQLHDALQHHDRPKFESLLKQYKSEIEAAARHFGADIESPFLNAFYKLTTFWLPKGVQNAIEAAVKCLPESARHWGRQTSATLVTKTPFQLLFVDHVHAIQNA